MLYARLPPALQHAVCSLVGLRAARAQYGGDFPVMLAEMRRRERASREEIAALRDARLRDFVRHCAATVPRYRRWFDRGGVDPGDIATLADLQTLPVLRKSQVQQDADDFRSEAVPKRHLVAVHTSGTTGAGLRFHSTASAIREQFALWWRYRRWHGLRPNIWCAYFGGRPIVPARQRRAPFWRYDLPGRRILFSGYHMAPDHLPRYVDELRRRRPPWLHGYPSMLALLAVHVAEQGADLGYQVRWVTTGSENLIASQADAIARAFGVRPRQHYGSAEAVANISECELGKLHVDEDFAPVEFLPTQSGDFAIVGSNVSNPATPLLRYDTGDRATLDDAPCPCGRPGRIVASLDGRSEDYVVLGNGARIGRMDHIFKDMVQVREAQIVQRGLGRLDVRIVRGAGYDADAEDALRREFAKRLGGDMRISFDYVRELERSRTGKLRFVISELSDGKLE